MWMVVLALACLMSLALVLLIHRIEKNAAKRDAALGRKVVCPACRKPPKHVRIDSCGTVARACPDGHIWRSRS